LSHQTRFVEVNAGKICSSKIVRVIRRTENDFGFGLGESRCHLHFVERELGIESPSQFEEGAQRRIAQLRIVRRNDHEQRSWPKFLEKVIAENERLSRADAADESNECFR
jgi:hypothetical protein